VHGVRMQQWRMGKRFGDCSSADVSGGDCIHEQSTSASEKTHACDCCQNQMERTEDMRGVRPMGASAVAGASYIM
jgi:hypothetical protein